MNNLKTAGQARRKRIEAVVVVVIVVVMLTMVATVIRHTHQASLALRCRRRLISLFVAVQHYALSYGGHPPGQDAGGNWRGLIAPLLDAGEQGQAELEQFLQCPAGGAYVGNRNILASDKTLSSFRLTLEVGVFADGDGAAETGGSMALEWRHDGGANVVFLDGHVERVIQKKSVRVRRHWDTPQ